jgi:hypothetical protein
MKNKVIEWVQGIGQRRASTILSAPRSTVRDKIAGRRDWPTDEVIDWARRAGLLPTPDAFEDSEPIDDGSEPLTEALEVSSWVPAPRLRVRAEPWWLGDAVEESDEFDGESTDDEDGSTNE